MEGHNCDVSQLPHGICPGVTSGLPWTHAVPRLLTSNCETALPAAKKRLVFIQDQGYTPCPGSYAGWPSHSRTNGEAFSSAWTPRNLCLPGILASPLKTVQSRKALLPMYLSEGGMASSTGAAQFMKALARITWRVVGRRTSLRLVQCTKVNSGISSTLVLQRSTLLLGRPSVARAVFAVVFGPQTGAHKNHFFSIP